MGLNFSKGLKSCKKDKTPKSFAWNSAFPKKNYHNFNFYNQEQFYNSKEFSQRNYNKQKEFSQHQRDIRNYSIPLTYDQICQIFNNPRNVGYPDLMARRDHMVGNAHQNFNQNQYKNVFQAIPLQKNFQYFTENKNDVNRFYPCKKCQQCKCFKEYVRCKPRVIFEEVYPLDVSKKKVFFEKENRSDKNKAADSSRSSSDFIIENAKKVNFNSTNSLSVYTYD